MQWASVLVLVGHEKLFIVIRNSVSLPNEERLWFIVQSPLSLIACSLGSTRFLKVAKSRSSEGAVVIKVFVIHDPSLNLKPYIQRTEGEIISAQRIRESSNQIPSQLLVTQDHFLSLWVTSVIHFSLRNTFNSVYNCWLWLAACWLGFSQSNLQENFFKKLYWPRSWWGMI